MKKRGMMSGLLQHDSRDIKLLERRLFLQKGLSLGALTMLSGCTLGDDAVQQMLTKMSRWNDGVQGFLFDPSRLATEYPESAITDPFPFNAFYGEDEVTEVDAGDYSLELSGMIRDQKPWTLPQLYALPQASQITRHICVEGWSAIGKWSGVPFRTFLERVGADLSAKYVGFKCADQILPPKYGFPMKLRIPTKLGFKNPKHIMAIYVTNKYPGGYWEDQGYNWFSGS
jgi:DMSO/TMAO reductase YedYZ molybdopterin-dependent catalytic subunit